MGAQQARELTQPQVEKFIGDGAVEHEGDSLIRYGFCSCQGWRKEMEDAHSCVDKIESLPGCSFFGVFDGHGGSGAAHFVSTSLLPKIIEHTLSEMDSQDANALAKLHEKLETAVPSAFIAMDNYMSEHVKEYARPGDTEDPGTTAITSIVTPSHVVFAHLGDARAVLCRGGAPVFATVDHKPDMPEETRRIVAAGGFVAAKRVCRCLAVSRAFGDHYFKSKDADPVDRMVSCVPDVTVLPRHPEDEFLLLACDGVWDVMTAQQICVFVRDKLLGAESVSEVCNALVEHCLRKGSTDNITAILVCFSGAKNGAVVTEMIDSWFDNIAGEEDGEDEEENEEESVEASAEEKPGDHHHHGADETELHAHAHASEHKEDHHKEVHQQEDHQKDVHEKEDHHTQPHGDHHATDQHHDQHHDQQHDHHHDQHQRGEHHPQDGKFTLADNGDDETEA